MSDSGHVAFRVENRIATITFTRPEKKNAFTTAMYAQFTAALREAEEDNHVRVVVLTGAGGDFSAGNDLKDFMGDPPTNGDAPVFQLIRALAFFGKPLLAAVEGVAVGIGSTMLLHCDLIYAGDGAKFVMPFVNLGVTPEAGSSLLLPKIVGMPMAMEMILLGEKMDVAMAQQVGLINKIAMRGGALAVAMADAEKIAEKPPGAVQAAKRLLREPIRQALGSVLQDEGATFVGCLGSPESEEAFTAFFGKRKPDFSAF
ncbi:MAG: enoyl-CoA hydratase/carnithine racemase [Bradymonadia bacterium]|jgi:enoyl-CoA hydratase/carnithine racemase